MENLRTLREQKGITQLRLSVEIGVAQETVSGYELGKTMPSAETLCKIADFLDTSTDYLLDRTHVKAPVTQLTIDGLSADELEVVSLFKKMSKEQRDKAVGFMMGILE
ncbi:MAG: helix-turn-helix transcriptional regulator [Clostridia bacterium]|nr:helix-turn-helix transcriptional regulator [Clostridia bacterium]